MAYEEVNNNHTIKVHSDGRVKVSFFDVEQQPKWFKNLDEYRKWANQESNQVKGS